MRATTTHCHKDSMQYLRGITRPLTKNDVDIRQLRRLICCKRSPSLSWKVPPVALESYKRLRDHKPWGFIIYRCDYRDDSVWAHFMERWSQRINQWLIRKNERQLIDNLAWTVREDRNVLDRATVEEVRKLFTTWTKTEEALAERQTAIDREALYSPRYRFCIHVDAKALDACLRYDVLPEVMQLKFWCRTRDPALGHAPYVNIVESVVEIGGDPGDDDDEEPDSDEEVDVITLKTHWLSAIPDVYSNLSASFDVFQRIARDVDQDGVHA